LNGPLANHPFAKKREILQAGALAMNREVIAAERWGAAETRARADRLAERIVDIWPGPTRSESAGGSRDWTRLHQAIALVPAGAWTTYGDLAELIGSHPVPVGTHLANQPVPNAWRALTADGRPSKQFRWGNSDRTETQREVLEAEGVTFDSSGRAAPEQRLSGAELAALIGLDVPQDNPSSRAEASGDDLYERFLHQLDQAQTAAIANGVRQLTDRWESLGGWLSLGAADETSCFPMLDRDSGYIWPLAIYPQSGTVEVVFQHLARRTPFDDPSVRRELLDRLNQIEGIRLPEAKLSMRPSFPISVLGRPTGLEGVADVLEWFVTACRSADAMG
jgi:alkylated DNA nucleotide flippase Atl1